MYNSIYPNYVQSYIGINNRQISRKKDEEKNSQSSQSAEENVQDSNKNMQRKYGISKKELVQKYYEEDINKDRGR